MPRAYLRSKDVQKSTKMSVVTSKVRKDRKIKKQKRKRETSGLLW